jgi:hypothetical protein
MLGATQFSTQLRSFHVRIWPILLLCCLHGPSFPICTVQSHCRNFRESLRFVSEAGCQKRPLREALIPHRGAAWLDAHERTLNYPGSNFPPSLSLHIPLCSFPTHFINIPGYETSMPQICVGPAFAICISRALCSAGPGA